MADEMNSTKELCCEKDKVNPILVSSPSSSQETVSIILRDTDAKPDITTKSEIGTFKSADSQVSSADILRSVLILGWRDKRPWWWVKAHSYSIPLLLTRSVFLYFPSRLKEASHYLTRSEKKIAQWEKQF